MNFKSILVLGLSVATIGLSVPAHADDTATVVNSTQDTIVTGTGNETAQSNSSRVTNRTTGRSTSGNTGTAIGNVQTSDIQGKYNSTIQVNDTAVDNYKRRSR
jgi:hypothetical protein